MSDGRLEPLGGESSSQHITHNSQGWPLPFNVEIHLEGIQTLGRSSAGEGRHSVIGSTDRWGKRQVLLIALSYLCISSSWVLKTQFGIWVSGFFGHFSFFISILFYICEDFLKGSDGLQRPLLICYIYYYIIISFYMSVQFSGSVVSNTLRPHKSHHTRPPCPSPTPGLHSDSRPSCQWCHPAISSSVIPFSSCPQSLPASESFPMSQLFAWVGQSTGVSALASFPPKKSQGWSPSEWTGWISLQCKGLSRVFSNTTVQKHQFFGTQRSSQSKSHIHTWPLEKP